MQKQIQSAVALYSSGQAKKALDIVESLIIDFPNEAIIYNLSGACFSALEDYENAANSYRKAILIKNDYAEVHNNLGVCLQNLGNYEDAIGCYMNAIAVNSNYADPHNNLGNTYKEINQLDSAIASYEKSLEINPNFAFANFNLGLIFQNKNELLKAISYYEKAIEINPNYFEAYNNLGGALQYFGKMNLAVDSYKKAISIKPDFIDAYINLGIALTELERTSEAKSSLRKAISIDSNSALAHTSLGNALKDQGNFDEAEICFKKAIEVNPDFTNALNNLAIVLYSKGKIDASLEYLKKAYSNNPESKLLLSVIGSKNNLGSESVSASDRLSTNPLILNREIESELIDILYDMHSIELDEVRDPGYGNAKGSDIRKSFFESDRPIVKLIEKDLINIMKAAVNADIYIDESWFVILGAGGGLNSHNHLSYLDKDSTLNLASQKYSLVYYVSPGDQDCTEPGFLKLYEPNEDVLPRKGMVLIFPADRPHSVIYNGKEDRIIIGINFYSL